MTNPSTRDAQAASSITTDELAALLAEREACAAIARTFGGSPAPMNDGMGTTILRVIFGPDVADAILARGKKEGEA